MFSQHQYFTHAAASGILILMLNHVNNAAEHLLLCHCQYICMPVYLYAIYMGELDYWINYNFYCSNMI